ncbi:MAG: SDR family oxidoreductase [Dehalococcoidales bacterium]|nr:SDR family oxidoreductase [Dehalococcoidales bacterium]
MKLADKTAIVTGAASGMGRAIAALFAREGAKVIVADIDDKGGNETADIITSTGRTAFFVRTDVAQPEQVKELINAAVNEYSKIDIMVNNAGIFMRLDPLEDIEEETWDNIYSVNVKGIFHGAKYVIPVMKKAGGGVIINTSSMTGHKGVAMQSAYSSSKAASINLTQALASELAPHHIRVNCICPALTETPMLFNHEIWEHVSGMSQAFGRLVRPEDIAATALFLASDDAAMITGLCLDVNGGQGV